MLRSDENGLLVPCKDVQSLCAAMTKMADDKEQMRELANNAKRIRSPLSVEKITQDWIEYCQSLMAKEKG